MSLSMLKTCPQCGKLFGPDARWPQNFKRQKHCGNACMQAAKKDTPEKSEKKFWSRVDKNGPNGCWIWTACTNERGYGMATWAGRKNIRAHRLAYELLRGQIPEGLFCLHKCDNRRCVNPDHIFFGLYKENSADMISKDRHARGERNKRNKLTDDKAYAILLKKPTRQRIRGFARSIAKEYGIGVGAVHAIWRGDHWKHLSRKFISKSE